MSGWSASTSGYYEGSGRAGQVRRAHLTPPDGMFPRRSVPTVACGAPWWAAQDAPRQPIPLGEPLPAGLTWCPKCLGVAVEKLGLAEQVAALVVARIR